MIAHNLIPGYRWLFEHARVLHREISLNNLMLRKEGNRGYTSIPLAQDVQTWLIIVHHQHRRDVRALSHPWQSNPSVHMYLHDLEVGVLCSRLDAFSLP